MLTLLGVDVHDHPVIMRVVGDRASGVTSDMKPIKHELREHKTTGFSADTKDLQVARVVVNYQLGWDVYKQKPAIRKNSHKQHQNERGKRRNRPHLVSISSKRVRSDSANFMR